MTSKGLITILKTKGKVICNIYFQCCFCIIKLQICKCHLLNKSVLKLYDEVNPYYKVKGNEI